MLFRVILFWIILHILCIKTINGFTCLNSGNFPNPDVIDCSSYISCRGNLITGFSIQIHECPAGSVFNLKTCVCDDEIQCLENAVNARNLLKVSTFVCPNIGKYADIDSPDCRGFFVCMRNLDFTLYHTLYDCPVGTIFDGKTGSCASGLVCESKPKELYDCKASGYFPDNSSLDCTKYFFCKKIANSKFEVFSRTCPIGSLFNANAIGCVLPHTYICPLGKPENEFKCPFTGNYVNSATDDCKTYYQCSRDDSGELTFVLKTCENNYIFNASLRVCVQSLITACTIGPPVVEFTCQSTGFVIDEYTPYCKGYLSCKLNSDETFTISQNYCENGKVFHPVSKKCVLDRTYICPSLEILSQGFDCPDTGNYVSHSTDDCRTYQQCKISTSGELTNSFLACGVDMVFDPMVRSCVQSSLYECNSTAEIPTNEFACPGIGNFADLLSTDCKNYYNCKRYANNTLYFTSKTCESGYVYNAILRNCVEETSYKCPMMDVTTEIGETTELSTDTEEAVTKEFVNTTELIIKEPTEASTDTSTTDALTTDTTSTSETTTSLVPDDFVCTSDGLFPDKSTDDCTKFFWCHGTEKYSYTCAIGTIYHPIEQLCVLDSMFSCTSTGITYECSDNGPISDPYSTNCSSYYICASYRDSFISIKLPCPPRMVFDPTLGLCVPQEEYLCPSL